MNDAILAPRLAELGPRAHDYLQQAKAANTRRAYAADWQALTAGCDQHQLAALPAAPETAAFSLTPLAVTRSCSPTEGRLNTREVLPSPLDGLCIEPRCLAEPDACPHRQCVTVLADLVSMVASTTEPLMLSSAMT